MLLKGKCNRCPCHVANCCRLGNFVCDHLRIEDNNRCDVYAFRYNDMPIVLTAPDGRKMAGYCFKGESETGPLTELVLQGKCSYTLEG